MYHGGTLAAQRHDNIFTSYERYVQSFAHIGIPAHEFAHVIGAADQYSGNITTGRWSLMAYGLYNGNDLPNPPWGYTRKGNYPAPFEPEYRIRFNWVTPVVLEPQEGFEVQYNYSSPYFYKINIPGSSEYFIIERRRKDGYDRYTPEKEVDNPTYYPPKGILIWHIAPDAVSIDEIELEYANGDPDPQTNNRFPYPSTSIQDFTDLTSPSSNKRDGDNSFISIKNIEWIGDQQTGYAEIDYIVEALEITGTETWSTTRALAVPVYIKDEGTLNIINGAYIHFNGDFVEQLKIFVEDGATLNLTGSENNKVVLLSGDYEAPIRKWGGIEIHGNGILESNFAIIQDALDPISVSDENANCSLDNTEIIGNKVSLNGNINIDNSVFNEASLLIGVSNNGSQLKRTIFSSELPNELFAQLGSPDVSYLEVANCTFDGMNYGLVFGNHGTTNGEDWTNKLTVRNNIFSNCNTSIEINGGTISISYNNFFNNNTDENTGSNYLTVDPLYVDPGNSDFNLQWGSGCIDAGNPSSSYNDPDGTRNDIGAKYYDQSQIIPANFTVTPGPGDHPLLEWEGEPHLSYKVYALYEYYNGTTSNSVYPASTESFVDYTIIFVEPTEQGPNLYATYSVTSINSIDVESEHTEEITIDGFGRAYKKSFIDSSFVPVSYNLFNPYPNPFNPSTTVVFDLPEKSFVTIKLYSITGEEVRTIVNEQMNAGRYPFQIDGNGLSSGIYLVRMISNSYISAKKIILMK